ncbi:MAG: ABC transporter permease [Bacilli bacterium]
MMRVSYQMTKALLLSLLRDRKALIILLAMPLVTTALLSFALGSLFQGKAIPPFTVAVYNSDTGVQGTALVRALAGTSSQMKVRLLANAAQAHAEIVDGGAAVLVQIPKDFSQMVAQGKTAPVLVETSLNGAAQSTIVNSVIEQYGVIAGEHLYAARHSVQGKIATQLPNVQATVLSTGVHAMTSGSYYAVGMMVLFLLNTALGRSYSILYDRKSSMFQRLTAAPVKKGVLTIGYLTANFIALCLQGAVNLICDRYVLGIFLGPWLQTLLLLAVYAAALSGIAVMVGSWIDHEGVLNGVSGIVGNLAAILGGSMLPIYEFPKVMQDIARILPNGEALNGFLNSISGIALSGLAVSLAYLLGIAVVTGVLARMRQWRPIR